MGAVVEVEVEAVAHLDDVDAVDVRAVAQDELLQPEEGALVRHLLPHLHHRDPRVKGQGQGQSQSQGQG